MSSWPFCSKNVSGQRKKARPSLERTAPFKQSTHYPLVKEGQTSGSNQALRAWEGRECSFFWSCETSHCHSLTLTAARPWPPKLPKLLKLLKLAQVALVALLRSAARIWSPVVVVDRSTGSVEKRGGVDNTFVWVQCIFQCIDLDEVPSWWDAPLPTLTWTGRWHQQMSEYVKSGRVQKFKSHQGGHPAQTIGWG
jgi:hypothetical protein